MDRDREVASAEGNVASAHRSGGASHPQVSDTISVVPYAESTDDAPRMKTTNLLTIQRGLEEAGVIQRFTRITDPDLIAELQTNQGSDVSRPVGNCEVIKALYASVNGSTGPLSQPTRRVMTSYAAARPQTRI